MHAAVAGLNCGILSSPCSSLEPSLWEFDWVAAPLSVPHLPCPSQHFTTCYLYVFIIFYLSQNVLALPQYSFHYLMPPLPLFYPLLPFACLLLPLFLSQSSSGQENDYAKQELDPSMCHWLIPQVPSEGPSPLPTPTTPSPPALLLPIDWCCISMAKNTSRTRHARSDNKDNWNSCWFSILPLGRSLAAMQWHIWDRGTTGPSETKRGTERDCLRNVTWPCYWDSYISVWNKGQVNAILSLKKSSR